MKCSHHTTEPDFCEQIKPCLLYTCVCKAKVMMIKHILSRPFVLNFRPNSKFAYERSATVSVRAKMKIQIIALIWWMVSFDCLLRNSRFESAIVATNPPLHVMRPAGICQFWRCDENVLFHFCSPPNGIGMNATAPAATASYLCAHHSRNIERQVKHSMIADRDMRRWQATSVSKRARLFVPPTLTRYGLVAMRYVNCNSTLRQRTISQHV